MGVLEPQSPLVPSRQGEVICRCTFGGCLCKGPPTYLLSTLLLCPTTVLRHRPSGYSHSRSSGSVDRKIRSASFTFALNAVGFFMARFADMSCILAEKGEIVPWSIVYCTKCTVCLSQLSIFSTTSPSLWFCDFATCLPEVSVGPGWLSEIGRGCVARMSRVLGVSGDDIVWAVLVDTQIQAVHCQYSCPWFPPVFFVS